MVAEKIEAALDPADERSTFVRCMSPNLAHGSRAGRRATGAAFWGAAALVSRVNGTCPRHKIRTRPCLLDAGLRQFIDRITFGDHTSPGPRSLVSGSTGVEAP